MQRQTLGPRRRIARAVLARDLNRELERPDATEALPRLRREGNPDLRVTCGREGDALRADLDRLPRRYVQRVRRLEVEQEGDGHAARLGAGQIERHALLERAGEPLRAHP